jgi:predicted nucleic-acid-binding protein
MLARGSDFADGVIRREADCAKCDRLVTFDQSFARLVSPDKVALLGTRSTP